jgi:hypothetical protein
MKNLLLNSLIILSVLCAVSCTHRGNARQGAGTPVVPQSAKPESTAKGTVSGTPGAVKNPGVNQAENDSIKQEKKKEKK